MLNITDPLCYFSANRILENMDETDVHPSKARQMKMADDECIIFIKEELAKYSFTTRKLVSEAWNDAMKTIGFINNCHYIDIPTLKAARIQERILSSE